MGRSAEPTAGHNVGTRNQSLEGGELYQDPTVVVIKTMLRWLMSDPVYQDRFMHYLSRALPNDHLMTPKLVIGAMLRGLGRDLLGRWHR